MQSSRRTCELFGRAKDVVEKSRHRIASRGLPVGFAMQRFASIAVTIVFIFAGCVPPTIEQVDAIDAQPSQCDQFEMRHVTVLMPQKGERPVLIPCTAERNAEGNWDIAGCFTLYNHFGGSLPGILIGTLAPGRNRWGDESPSAHVDDLIELTVTITP